MPLQFRHSNSLFLIEIEKSFSQNDPSFDNIVHWTAKQFRLDLKYDDKTS